MPLSLQEQLRIFSEASDGLREDVTDEELQELAKDIETKAADIWRYHELVVADSERLYAKAAELSAAARQQKNKAERIKSFLKFALRQGGFTKARFGDIRMALSTSKKAVAKRPATDADFFTNPDICTVKFRWHADPVMDDWSNYPHLVDPEFSFDVAALKKAGREDLLDYETTERLTVSVAKE